MLFKYLRIQPAVSSCSFLILFNANLKLIHLDDALIYLVSKKEKLTKVTSLIQLQIVLRNFAITAFYFGYSQVKIKQFHLLSKFYLLIV